MRPLWKLVVLSASLSVVLGLVHATPALAVSYYCIAVDPCTEELVFSRPISYCLSGEQPVCVYHYDSNCCIVEVTTAGCSVNPPPPAACPYLP